MGIPGVQSKALLLAKTHKVDFFAGGDFYVDGMNFAHRISGRNNAAGTQERWRAAGKRPGKVRHVSPYNLACKLVDQQLLKLKRLQPRSITVVIDGMISDEKFQIRLSRAESRLRKGETTMNANGVLAERIIACHNDVTLVYAGTEAEDEIMKLIDEDLTRGDRRQFVFSEDSDLYRFHIRNPLAVEIVPLVKQKLAKSIKSINLNTTMSAKIVPSRLHFHPPIARPGVSVVNPKHAIRAVVEFINCGNIHKRFYRSLGPLLIPGYHDKPLDMSPFDAGHEVRSAAYGYLMSKHFKDRDEVDTGKVEEWRQRGFKMEPTYVVPLKGETLELALRALRTSHITAIIRNQLEQVSTKYAMSSSELNGIVRMIKDISTRNRRAPLDAVNDRTHRLFSLLEAILKSLIFFNQALDIPHEIEGMDLQVSPHHLQAYLKHGGKDFAPVVPTAYLAKFGL